MLGSNQRPPPCRDRTTQTPEVSSGCGKPRSQRDFGRSALCVTHPEKPPFTSEACAICAQHRDDAGDRRRYWPLFPGAELGSPADGVLTSGKRGAALNVPPAFHGRRATPLADTPLHHKHVRSAPT
jgi:hypothetical protein